ncbi:unnamed protein product [Acanthosepion pharaonis]|uniref:Uncharacterized protein n=1 Tax=Acanthosepion pharaonis TaxID=158019 RepID=A0A812EDK4_ACAPH|nr:unnamed protein product [Sepia pharaonis]
MFFLNVTLSAPLSVYNSFTFSPNVTLGYQPHFSLSLSLSLSLSMQLSLIYLPLLVYNSLFLCNSLIYFIFISNYFTFFQCNSLLFTCLSLIYLSFLVENLPYLSLNISPSYLPASLSVYNSFSFSFSITLFLISLTLSIKFSLNVFSLLFSYFSQATIPSLFLSQCISLLFTCLSLSLSQIIIPSLLQSPSSFSLNFSYLPAPLSDYNPPPSFSLNLPASLSLSDYNFIPLSLLMYLSLIYLPLSQITIPLPLSLSMYLPLSYLPLSLS